MGIFPFVWLRTIFYMVTCGNPMPTSQGFVMPLAGAMCRVKILRMCELLSERIGSTGVMRAGSDRITVMFYAPCHL